MIIISCVDAGSANFLVPVIPLIKYEVVVYTAGAATEIFNTAGVISHVVKASNWQELKAVARDVLVDTNPHLVICGTSWGLSLDKAFTWEARALGITTLSAIDHWRLLRERYVDASRSVSMEELTFMTDFVFVIDENVKESIVKLGVDSPRIFVVGNPHLEYIENLYSDLDAEVGHMKPYPRDILFVSEIVRGALVNHPYDEYLVLDDLLTLSNSLGLSLDVKLHPNEDIHKYSELALKPNNIIRNIDALKMASNYNFIVGMDSMLLFEMAIFRPLVISYRPECDNEGADLFNSSAVLTVYRYSELESLFQSGLKNSFTSTKRFGGSALTVSKCIDDLMECV